jgi:plasmid stabilization system protein ParE
VKRITLHPAAEDELRTSERFYQDRSGHEPALDFARRVRTALQIVAGNPERFPPLSKYPEVQKARVTRFPFSIYYIEREYEIWVIARARKSVGLNIGQQGSDHSETPSCNYGTSLLSEGKQTHYPQALSSVKSTFWNSKSVELLHRLR